MKQLSKFWILVRRFWLLSDRRIFYFILFAVVVGLSVSRVGFSVLLNQWNGDFFNAIQAMDGGEIYVLLGKYILIIVGLISLNLSTWWLRQKFEIDSRKWITYDFISRWMSSTSQHYRLQLAGATVDNPDQRIAEDIRLLIDQSMGLLISFLRCVLTLASFITILWTLSGSLDLAFIGLDGWSIPGYMVWVCFIWTFIATVLTHVIGKPLKELSFQQQKREADFRSGLISCLHNSEAVAGQRGEKNEVNRLKNSFRQVVRNWYATMFADLRLSIFTGFYNQVSYLAPIFFALPTFLSGAIQLGGLMQIRNAFGHLESSISWFIFSYRRLADWSATVDRLYAFEESLNKDFNDQTVTVVKKEEALPTDPTMKADLTLNLPTGETLLKDVSVALYPGHLTVIKGASGIGKSCLLRALAGFWPYYQGDITTQDPQPFWVPQRLWFPSLGLKSIMAYPKAPEEFDDALYEDMLKLVGLEKLIPDSATGEVSDWVHRLSGGEQQRLIIARILLVHPSVLLLDETTSALDADNTEKMLALIKERMPDTSVLMVSHQITVHNLADTLITIKV